MQVLQFACVDVPNCTVHLPVSVCLPGRSNSFRIQVLYPIALCTCLPVSACRYSGFLLLYPIGVSSELTMAWLALPFIKSTGLWSIEMPNSWNFGFSYWLANILIMLTYIPGGQRSSTRRQHSAARLCVGVWVLCAVWVCSMGAGCSWLPVTHLRRCISSKGATSLLATCRHCRVILGLC